MAKWTDDEWARASHLMAHGHDVNSTARILGRSPAMLRDKIRYETMTEEQRQARCARIREWKANSGRAPAARIHHERPTTLVVLSPEQIEERERRLSAPRTLTGILLGDPPIGFSALERRV